MTLEALSTLASSKPQGLQAQTIVDKVIEILKLNFPLPNYVTLTAMTVREWRYFVPQYDKDE